jgi:hypothetical protein
MNSCHVCRRICDRPIVTRNAESRVLVADGSRAPVMVLPITSCASCDCRLGS